MKQNFGPWSTAINTGNNPQLSTFWKRRLTMLVPTAHSRAGLTCRAGFCLALLAAAVTSIPTVVGFAQTSVAKSAEPIVKSAAPSKDRTEYAVWLARWQAEQKAIEEIKKLGGSVKTEVCAPESVRKQLGEKRSRFVTFVNMMSRDDKNGRSVSNRNDSDQALQHVKHFTQLKRLFLKGTQATDENLKHLAGLKKLQVLYMWYASKVTDEGFVHLQQIHSLTYIHCSYSGITDDALDQLFPLKHLEVLDLVGNDFTDRALENVSTMTGLKVLSIGAGNVRGITDDGLVHLKKLTKLESLNLMATSVTDKGLDHLKHLKNLKTLWISATAVTINGAAELKIALPKLRININ